MYAVDGRFDGRRFSVAGSVLKHAVRFYRSKSVPTTVALIGVIHTDGQTVREQTDGIDGVRLSWRRKRKRRPGRRGESGYSSRCDTYIIYTRYRFHVVFRIKSPSLRPSGAQFVLSVYDDFPAQPDTKRFINKRQTRVVKFSRSLTVCRRIVPGRSFCSSAFPGDRFCFCSRSTVSLLWPAAGTRTFHRRVYDARRTRRQVTTAAVVIDPTRRPETAAHARETPSSARRQRRDTTGRIARRVPRERGRGCACHPSAVFRIRK